MAYFFGLILVSLSFTYKKNKLLLFVVLFFMFIMFAFSYGNADWNIYNNRFDNYLELSGETEPLFTLTMKTLHLIGFSYRSFLILLSLASLFVIYFITTRLTKFSNLVLALYFIYPFCFDVTMIRFTYASIFVYLAFYFLLSKPKRRVLLFSLFILLASLIHFACLLFLLFSLLEIIPKHKRKAALILMFFVFLVLFVFVGLNLSFLTSISFLNIGQKIQNTLTFAGLNYDNSRIIKNIFKFLIVYCLQIFLLYYIKRTVNKSSTSSRLLISRQLEQIDRIFQIVKASILILPFMIVDTDFFRIQIPLLLLTYIALANYFDVRAIKYRTNLLLITDRSFISCLLGLSVSFSSLYLWVLSGPNYTSVFKAFFENNTVLSLF